MPVTRSRTATHSSVGRARGLSLVPGSALVGTVCDVASEPGTIAESGNVEQDDTGMSVEIPSTGVNSSKTPPRDRAALGEVDRAVRGIGLSSVLQPIVALPDGVGSRTA